MFITVGCPTILRTDRGTENTNIAFLQPFLRDQHDDPFAKEKSFMYGRSTSNQVCLPCISLFVCFNRAQTSVLRLGGDSSARMLRNGGWIILRYVKLVFHL